MKIIVGDLITLAKKGEFDVITHSCNCFCRMKRGIAPILASFFGCDKFPMEDPSKEGDINKLGMIDYKKCGQTIVVNSYMQFHWKEPSKYGIPFDYAACRLCLRKINRIFPNKKIGLPMIGCGLAGGDPKTVLRIINDELVDCDVSLVVLTEEYKEQLIEHLSSPKSN